MTRELIISLHSTWCHISVSQNVFRNTFCRVTEEKVSKRAAMLVQFRRGVHPIRCSQFTITFHLQEQHYVCYSARLSSCDVYVVTLCCGLHWDELRSSQNWEQGPRVISTNLLRNMTVLIWIWTRLIVFVVMKLVYFLLRVCSWCDPRLCSHAAEVQSSSGSALVLLSLSLFIILYYKCSECFGRVSRDKLL